MTLQFMTTINHISYQHGSKFRLLCRIIGGMTRFCLSPRRVQETFHKLTEKHPERQNSGENSAQRNVLEISNSEKTMQRKRETVDYNFITLIAKLEQIFEASIFLFPHQFLFPSIILCNFAYSLQVYYLVFARDIEKGRVADPYRAFICLVHCFSIWVPIVFLYKPDL